MTEAEKADEKKFDETPEADASNPSRSEDREGQSKVRR